MHILSSLEKLYENSIIIIYAGRIFQSYKEISFAKVEATESDTFYNTLF